MKRALLIILLILAVSTGALYWRFWEGEARPANLVRLAGHIEVTKIDLAFQVPGKITAITVDEGQQVKVGQVVAKLDDQLLRQELEIAKGRVEAADALERPKKLKDAELRQTRAQLEQARLRLKYATLTSPVAGVVLTRAAEPGELTVAGAPILTLGVLDNLWFEGFLSETDLGKVKLGQPAAVTIDSFPGKKYAGTVSHIANQAEFTPKTVETFKERVTLVYRVKIKLADSQQELKQGMPAEADISLNSP